MSGVFTTRDPPSTDDRTCGNVLDLAGGTWRVDGNGHLWVWCDDWDAVSPDGVTCDDCGDFLRTGQLVAQTNHIGPGWCR